MLFLFGGCCGGAGHRRQGSITSVEETMEIEGKEKGEPARRGRSGTIDAAAAAATPATLVRSRSGTIDESKMKEGEQHWGAVRGVAHVVTPKTARNPKRVCIHD